MPDAGTVPLATAQRVYVRSETDVPRSTSFGRDVDAAPSDTVRPSARKSSCPSPPKRKSDTVFTSFSPREATPGLVVRVSSPATCRRTSRLDAETSQADSLLQPARLAAARRRRNVDMKPVCFKILVICVLNDCPVAAEIVYKSSHGDIASP